MSAAKHTVGPWAIQYETDITGIENDPANGCVGLVDVAHVYMRTVPCRTEANARLIAAAPDMIDALRQWANAEATADEIELQNARASRDEAIAKATGQKP